MTKVNSTRRIINELANGFGRRPRLLEHASHPFVHNSTYMSNQFSYSQIWHIKATFKVSLSKGGHIMFLCKKMINYPIIFIIGQLRQCWGYIFCPSSSKCSLKRSYIKLRWLPCRWSSDHWRSWAGIHLQRYWSRRTPCRSMYRLILYPQHWGHWRNWGHMYLRWDSRSNLHCMCRLLGKPLQWRGRPMNS